MGLSYRALARSFFAGSPLEVAPALLGKLIVRRLRGREIAARIVETEAYLGADDPAAHAARGLTRRTAVLYGPPGHAYVYLIYGMHWCLNVSSLPDGTPGGILFRAAQQLATPDAPGAALKGPGRLTRALAITGTLNRHDLTRPGPLFLADDGFPTPTIAIGPRIGISQARHLPYRFAMAGHAAISAPFPRE